jgi:potassium-dependent mechanosensitive channel
MPLFIRLLALFCALWAQSATAQPAAASAAAPAAQASPSLAPAAPDAAQAATDQALRSAQATLKAVDQPLGRKGLTDSNLQTLRDQLAPAMAQAQQVVQDLMPRLEAVQARLKQIGPAPAAGAPPEPAALTSTRDQQLAFENTLNSELAQAKVAVVDAGQMAGRISARRRDLFVSNVFAHGHGLFSPSLWAQAFRETPRDFTSVWVAWLHWSDEAEQRLDGWTLLVFLAALSAIAVLYVACEMIARRILAREPGTTEPTRLAKALASVWVTFLTALPPILSIVSLIVALRGFGLADASVDPFLRTVAFSVVRISLALAIAQGLLAPGRPNWRLLDLTTQTCETLLRLAVAVAVVISLGKILNSIADQVAFSVPMSLAIRGVTALVVALVMAVSLRGLVPDEDSDDCLGPRIQPKTDWYAPLRFAAWATIVVLLVAAAIGYVAFSAFLLDQLVWVSLLGSALFVSLILVDEGLAAAFLPNGVVGKALVRSLGLRRDSLRQLAILTSGVVTLALCLAAIFLVLAPWRIESTDMLGGVQAAFFGFQVAGLTISLSAIVVAIVVFVVGLFATRWIQRWFDTRLLPATRLDLGLRNSIRTSIGYVGIIAATVLSLARLGVDFQKIAIVAGALSVGIGFGLQSIVNNFVSGLIVLWERAIRVGDLVMVGDEQGHVKRINVRSTEIETFDRVTMIVPNSNLVTGVVKNWVRTDRSGRIKISVGFGVSNDPEQIRTIMIGCARDHGSVVKLPAPQALLTSIDGSLKFELVCFVDDVETAGRIKSDLHFELYRRFKDVGLESAPAAPAPTQVTVQLAGLEAPRTVGGEIAEPAPGGSST